MNLNDSASVGELTTGIGTVLMLIFFVVELHGNRWQKSLSRSTVAGFISWFVDLGLVLPMIGHGGWRAHRECGEPR